MAIKLMDTLETAGNYPLIGATDVGMPDGKRLTEHLATQSEGLSEQITALVNKDKALVEADASLAKRTKAVEDMLADMSISYPIADGVTNLLPETYYVFGEVDSLAVSLASVDDGKVHEYCFEFIPSKNFAELTVTPAPSWANVHQYPAGKVCQVSILRGVGVIVCA